MEKGHLSSGIKYEQILGRRIAKGSRLQTEGTGPRLSEKNMTEVN